MDNNLIDFPVEMIIEIYKYLSLNDIFRCYSVHKSLQIIKSIPLNKLIIDREYNCNCKYHSFKRKFDIIGRHLDNRQMDIFSNIMTKYYKGTRYIDHTETDNLYKKLISHSVSIFRYPYGNMHKGLETFSIRYLYVLSRFKLNTRTLTNCNVHNHIIITVQCCLGTSSCKRHNRYYRKDILINNDFLVKFLSNLT